MHELLEELPIEIKLNEITKKYHKYKNKNIKIK
jgi:hypothetical protein